MENTVIQGFAPLIEKNSKVLFLGSMPSKISREVDFFYGNPTNRFWKILSSIYNENFVSADREEKIRILKKHNIAMWDVYGSCIMKKEGSSMDSDITGQTFNDIPSALSGTEIKKIFITSKKAYLDFIKHFKNFLDGGKVQVVSLPSPSSANRSQYKTDEDLINAWKKIIEN